MQIYWSPRSRSFASLWALEETGMPYEAVLTDISTGAQKTPDYLAINPMGKVPALKDGNAIVAESAAVIAYISEKYPDAKLGPPLGDPARGKYLQWLFFNANIEAAIMQIFTKIEVPSSTAGWGSATQVFDVLDKAVENRTVDSRRELLGRRHRGRGGSQFRDPVLQDGADAAVVRSLSGSLRRARGLQNGGKDDGRVKQNAAFARPAHRRHHPRRRVIQYFLILKMKS